MQQQTEPTSTPSDGEPGKELFCDPEFAVQYIKFPYTMLVEATGWRRPCELRKKPRMFVDGARRYDILQGEVGDCWFLSACAAVAEHPDLIKKVIPEGQVLFGDGYTGRLFFRFWHLGRWEEVEIDDRLPINTKGELVSSRCQDPDEFWLPLLEKAFAKFHGSYDEIDGGELPEGFVNLTGYSMETCKLDNRNKLFKHLRTEWKNQSLILCGRHDSEEKKGLLGGHAYTITALHRLRNEAGLVRLVRVRNPYGKMEWTGAWNDNDAVWNTLNDDIKKKLEYKKAVDGEYWMKFAHFLKHFDDVCVARKAPAVDEEQEESGQHCNVCVQLCGRWEEGKNAGGSPDKIQSFATNPQFVLIASESDSPEPSQNEVENKGSEDQQEIASTSEDEDDKSNRGATEPTCHVFIELMQEHNRQRVRNLYEIALFVYERTEEKRMSAADIEEATTVTPASFEQLSAVQLKLSLRPRVPYVLIASTKFPDEEKGFLLRVFSRKACLQLRELPAHAVKK